MPPPPQFYALLMDLDHCMEDDANTLFWGFPSCEDAREHARRRRNAIGEGWRAFFDSK